MSTSLIHEVIIGSILLIALLLYASTIGAWMPSMVQMISLIGLLLVFAIFASFVWKERPRDERELLHRALAGRLAFLAGAIMLVAAITVQALRHQVDYWLVATLAVMVIVKLVTLLTADRRR